MKQNQMNSQNSTQNFVNSYTQWGKLKTCIVGIADNAHFQPEKQPSDIPIIKDEKLREQIPWPKGQKLQSSIDRANKQLNELARILESEGVEVLRPNPKLVDFSKPIQTPWWKVENQYCTVCPRDCLITFGNVMMEAPMSRRDRYFEIMACRDIIEDLWKKDENCYWKAAPKNTMKDEMYSDYMNKSKEEQLRLTTTDTSYALKKDTEVVFDAADFTRTGKHIFGLISNTTNMNGIKWLQRELKPHGFEVHPIRGSNDPSQTHIDATFIVLKPGLIMVSPERPMFEEDKQYWIKNGWKFITAPYANNRNIPAFCQCSNWLNMNVLVISENKVIVEKQEVGMHQLLEENGFEVIKIDFRDVYEFGGGLHCSTVDLCREDSQVDLFPNAY